MSQQVLSAIHRQNVPKGSSLVGSLLQRRCACGQHTLADVECEQCRTHQTYGAHNAIYAGVPSVLPPVVQEVVQSPGQPLDAATRAFTEGRFGHDFSKVRVHTDEKAAHSAQSINALAYTVGQHMVFGASYAPATQAGRRLVAHELTHVLQQAAHTPQRQAAISEPTDAAEQEAERIAGQVMGQTPQGPVPQASQLAAPGAIILRYRSHGPYFGRDAGDLSVRIGEEAFRDPERQPWIEHIQVTFDGKAVDNNSALDRVPVTDRLMSTGHLLATYHKASLPAISTPVEGGSSVLGLTDEVSNQLVQRIEPVGYNAALPPGAPRYDWPLIPGTKYSKDPNPLTPIFTGQANMNWAVFYFKNLEALHEGPPGVGSHACVHVPRPFIQQINYHSVVGRTRVSVTYSSFAALKEVCCARRRQGYGGRNPCGSVTCP